MKIAIVSPGPVDTGFILDDLDKTDNITLSQPLSTADEVAQTILDLCGNLQEDVAMPWYTGVLATMSYLSPWVSRKIRPVLERKGAKRKARLKAARKTSKKNGPPS